MTASAVGQQAGLGLDAYQFERFTVQEGLSDNTIGRIFQDSKGFLWVGTNNGLNRFDGYTFQKFFHDADDPNSLGNNQIGDILEDSAGNIWIRTDVGLDRFDPVCGKFYRFLIPRVSIHAVYLDRSGSLVYGNNAHFLKYNSQAGSFDTIPFSVRFPDFFGTKSLHQDKKGVLWRGGNQGDLYRFDTLKNSFVFYGKLGKGPVYSLQEDRKGRLWAELPESGLFLLDSVRLNWTQVSDLKGLKGAFLPDGPGGDLWIGGVRLKQVSLSGETVEEWLADPEDLEGLSSRNITCLYKDQSGIIWIGTQGGGLIKMVPKNKGFFLFPENKMAPSNIIRAVTEDQVGNPIVVYQNSGEGTFKWNDRKSSWSRLPVPPAGYEWQNTWKSILAPSGVIWIGMRRSGIFNYDPTTGVSRLFPFVDGDWRERYIPMTTFHVAESGYIWLGFSVNKRYSDFPNLIRLNPRTGRRDSIFLEGQEPASQNDPFCFFEDRSGNFWMGTSQGLYLLASKTAKEDAFDFQYFRDSSDQSPAANKVSAIYEDKRGQFWIGTYGSGLKRFYRSDRSFERIEGLPDPFVYSILEDDENYLWVSSNRGVYRLDPRTGYAINFTAEDGLQGNEFNLGVAYKNRKGRMFFGGMNGLNAFYPEDIQMNTSPPSIFVTDIKVLGESIPSFGSNSTGPALSLDTAGQYVLDLSYSQSSVYLEFASSDFFQPEQNQFEYRIGEKEKWTSLGTQNSLLLPYLSPGIYPLQVRGTNRDGVWSLEPLRMEIEIHPPWWKTSYFYAALVLLTLGISWGFLRWRFAFFRRNENRLEQTVEERTSSLENALTKLKKTQTQLIQSEKMASLGILMASIAHEINNPLNFSKMSSDALETDFHYLKQHAFKVQEYLKQGTFSAAEQAALENEMEEFTKLAQLIDEEVDVLKEGSDRISSIVSGLLAFSKGKTGSFEPTDIHKGVEWVLKVLKSRNTSKIRIEKGFDPKLGLVDCHPGQINQVFLNLLTNALDAVEVQGGEIQITTLRKGEEVICSVKDNGIGMSPEVKDKVFDPFFTTKEKGVGTGLGLSICFGIVQAHGGEIKVFSEEGKGTEVIMTLPLKQKGNGLK